MPDRRRVASASAAAARVSPTTEIACVVLAAGAGTRFGAPGEKLAVPYRGKPLVQAAIDAACASSATVCSLILGAGFERVLAAIDARRSATYVNERWNDGLASSVALAVTIHADADACVFVLGDAPAVTAGDVDALIDAWMRMPRAIVALRAGRTWGAPMLFPRSDFTALASLRGDGGSKRYATTQRSRLRYVDASSADALVDVDRRADLTRSRALESRKTRRSPARR